MEKDIGKIKKNETTDIVIRVDDFGGKPGITIREFATTDRYTGFTKSGTRIPAEHFAEFRELINSIDIDEGEAGVKSEENSESEEESESEEQEDLDNESDENY